MTDPLAARVLRQLLDEMDDDAPVQITLRWRAPHDSAAGYSQLSAALERVAFTRGRLDLFADYGRTG